MLRTPARAAILVAAMLAFSPLAAAAAAAPTTSIPTIVVEDGPVTWSVEASPTAEGGRRALTYDVDPGTQIQDSFLITNAGDTAAEFIIYATDAFNDPDTGNFSLLKRDIEPTDLGAWITPADEKLTIGPGLQAKVPFNLLIPSDASPGDHAAGIVAAVLTETEQDGSTVLLEQRVGVRMYLTVSGEAVSSVEVQGMTSSFNPSLNPFAPGELTLNYDVRNTGNKRVDVTQAIQAAGIFGIPVGADEPEPLRDLLPRQSVRVVVKLDGVGALIYATSTVVVTPGAVGSAPLPADAAPDATPTPSATPTPETAAPTPGATPGEEAAAEEVEFEKVSEQSTTIAITWTLLGLFVLLAAAIFLIYRYVTGTRERMYAAIDEAAEAARAEAPEAARAEAAEAARLEAARATAAAARAKKKPAATKAGSTAKPKTPAAKTPAAKTTAAKASAAKAPAAAKTPTATSKSSAAKPPATGRTSSTRSTASAKDSGDPS